MHMLRDAAVAGLEAVLNAYLRLEPEVNARMARLHGKVICLDITGIDQKLYFVPSIDRLQVHGRHEAEPDTLLRGSLGALASLGLDQDKRTQLFGGRVEVIGDATLAHRFGKILADMDIDWEEQFSRLIGDVPAHQAGRLLRGLGDWAHNARRSLEMDLGEYLQEEVRLLPRAEEIALFANQVDDLRDDVERLAARCQRLGRHVEQDTP
jgi:ubiquinone biosynthesis protein UbiJ